MDLLAASIKEKLWHKLRQDLQSYIPEINETNLLMCCVCGRFLSYEDFNLEHIIPQQALADDPIEIKSNPETTANARSGVILLCMKRLLIKERIYNNGCNGWKGRYYDTHLRELLSGRILEHKHKKPSDQHIIAALCASYLAMILEFGYQVALTPSGVIMRQQFFSPHKFHRNLPLRHQMILSAPPPKYDESHFRIWSHPFNFTIGVNACYVGFRTMSLVLPISRDPRLPASTSMLIAPQKYKLRPDFRTVVD
jgi:hypothetical protein